MEKKMCIACGNNYKYRELSDYCTNKCEKLAVERWKAHSLWKFNSINFKYEL